MSDTAGPALDFDFGLFGRLRRDAATEWRSYIAHPFVKALGRGTLPQPWFQNFLIQDYLYLIQYARGYALAAYKSESLAELVSANRTMTALLDVEMPLHVSYCRDWGISQAELEGAAPDLRMTAYANFFLERGASGDRLDLEIALAPCLMGYAEIAELILADPETVLEGNPYEPWISSYSGAEYRATVAQSIIDLDAFGQRRGADARYASLLQTFRTASALEAQFWEIGWQHGTDESAGSKA
ncbi:TenA family protein [Acidisoma cellulosilyticum]|uniref:TenA family protein n=1 Tax=Acidisoma cellulosilyticum TaxID=2802395 RepID=UPI001D09DC4A|nr:TenA family protein [Acidisoma cellulosilyticum]